MTSCTLRGHSGRGDQLCGLSTPQVWGAGTNKEKSYPGTNVINVAIHNHHCHVIMTNKKLILVSHAKIILTSIERYTCICKG